MTSKIFSLRLKTETLDHLARRARERGELKSSLAQRLIEEGLRIEEHPGIEFRDGPTGRRAAVKGGPDVWQIIPIIRAEGGGERGVEAAASYLEQPLHRMQAAARYYAAYPDEIDTWIRINDELAERYEAEWLRQQAALAR
jgi:hypothetical protein